MNLSKNLIKNNNLIWTVAEDYSFVPDVNIFSFIDKEKYDENKYKYALIGFSNKYFLSKEVYKFLQLLDTSNTDDIKKIFELIIENTLWDELVINRPGIDSYRQKYIKNKLDNYNMHPPKNLVEELDYAFYLHKSSKTPKLTNLYYNLFKEILKSKPKDTNELIEDGSKIIKTFFHIDKNMKNSYEFKKLKKTIEIKTNEKEKPKIKFSKTKSGDLEKEDIQAAEFRQNFFDENEKEQIEKEISSNTINHLDKKNDENYKLVQSIYGNSILNQREKKLLENKISNDIHFGINLLITDGQFGDGLNEQFRQKQIEENKIENKKHYDRNILIYNRSISKLKDIIRNNILMDLETSETLSNSGKFIPALMWKPKYLNNDNVFLKDINDDLGTIAVDILLDSSASQLERQELVSSQAYVISTALSELNIPVRVFSFNNFSNYQILKTFRDYDDDTLKNDKIFEYSASGSNRDGYAIKLVSHLMEKTKYDRKILIVLSDGKPNDKIKLNMIDSANNDALDYIDDLAIEDSAKQVFNSRNSGNYILGVFTGDDEDLQNEKKIYGQDFAYIKDINRFSEIVGYFLKQVLINI